jgi:hypothetical protein
VHLSPGAHLPALDHCGLVLLESAVFIRVPAEGYPGATYQPLSDTPVPRRSRSVTSLDDGWIAFEAWDGSDWEIYLWDGVDIIPISDNDFLDREPSLSGNRVAWMARPDGPGTHDQIFYAKLPDR